MKANCSRWPLLFSAAALACANPASEPRRILARHLDAHFQQRYQEAYSFLSNEDQSLITPEQYGAAQKMSAERSGSLRESFKIKTITVAGDVARAQVAFESKGVPGWVASIGKEMEQEGKQGATEELEDIFKNPASTRDFILKNENGQWKVYLNFKMMGQVYALRAKGYAYEKKRNWESALDEYREIIKLHPGNREEADALGAINRLEQKTYSKHLTVTLIKKEQSSETGKLDVEFELVNSGDRKVDSLKFAFVAPAKQPAIVSGMPDLRSSFITVRDLSPKAKERYKIKRMPITAGNLEILKFSLVP